MVVLQCFLSKCLRHRNSVVMQVTLAAFVAGAGAQRCTRLEEIARLESRRAQAARLLLPWPRVRARRFGRPSNHLEWRERLGQLIETP